MGINNLLKTYEGLSKEVYVLFIGRIVNSLGAFVHPLMALILTQKIGLSVSESGMFITILSAFQAPAMIFGGKLADTIGRRKVIIICQFLGALTLIACGFMKPSITMAKIMILSSCLYSISSPAFEALNADITTYKNRKASYSLLYMGSNIGFCIGPILGGLLYENYLPLIFIGDGITTLIALALIILFVKERKINDENYENEEILSDLEQKVEGSAFKVLIQRPTLIFFSLGVLMYYFSYSQWGFALPIQLEDLFGSNGAKLYGLLGGINGVVVIVFTPIITSLTTKMNVLKAMSIGGLFYAIAFFMFGIVNTVVLFFIGVFLMTIGEILIVINQGTFIANNTPASHRGRISSILPLISGIGFAIGPMIMGDMIEKYNIFVGWMIVATVATFGMVTMMMIKKSMKNN